MNKLKCFINYNLLNLKKSLELFSNNKLIQKLSIVFVVLDGADIRFLQSGS